MADTGPYTMEGQRMEQAEAMALEFLKLCRQSAEEQLAGKPQVSDVHGGTIMGRTVISIAIQALMINREAAGINAFDTVDGLAHGIATWLAQNGVEGAAAAQKVLAGNIRGYEARTRAAFAQKGPLNG